METQARKEISVSNEWAATVCTAGECHISQAGKKKENTAGKGKYHTLQYLVGRKVLHVDLAETRRLHVIIGGLGRGAKVAARKLISLAVVSDQVLLALHRPKITDCLRLLPIITYEYCFRLLLNTLILRMLFAIYC